MTYLPPEMVQAKLNAPPAFSQAEHDAAVQAAVAKAMTDATTRGQEVKAAAEKLVAERDAAAAKAKEIADAKAKVEAAQEKERRTREFNQRKVEDMRAAEAKIRELEPQVIAEQRADLLARLAKSTKWITEATEALNANAPGYLDTKQCQTAATRFFGIAAKIPAPAGDFEQSKASLKLIESLRGLHEGLEKHCNMPGGPEGIRAITAKVAATTTSGWAPQHAMDPIKAKVCAAYQKSLNDHVTWGYADKVASIGREATQAGCTLK